MDKTKYPETLEEAQDYENARIPAPSHVGEMPTDAWLKMIFEVRKLTTAPVLFHTGVYVWLVTDKQIQILGDGLGNGRTDSDEDRVLAAKLLALAKKDAIYVQAFS